MDSLTPIKTAGQQLLSIVKGKIELLPNIVIAIVVFIIFWIIAKSTRRLIKDFTKRKQSRNLSLVLDRLSQGLVILIGAFVALAIAAVKEKEGLLVKEITLNR